MSYEQRAQAAIRKMLVAINERLAIEHAAIYYENDPSEPGVFVAGSPEVPTVKDFIDRVAKECLASDMVGLDLSSPQLKRGKVLGLCSITFVHDGELDEMVQDYAVRSADVSVEDYEAIAAVISDAGKTTA